jgi:hypothetical protein
MKSVHAEASGNPDPVGYWDKLLRPLVNKSSSLAEKFLEDVRAAKLTFGERVHCPFLRPVFLSPEDEERLRSVAEAIVVIAERITREALNDRSLFKQFHLRAEEERLARLNPGPGPASTASRLDAFLLPEALKFTEYNGESPAGSGYSETLSDIFRELPMMEEFKKRFEVHSYPLSAKLLEALVTTYVDWGGQTKRPQMAIVDWKDVPTWSEFEILKGRFERMGVAVVLADPRDLEFDGKTLVAQGKAIDLLYRRVLINDIVARPKECETLVKAYESGRVCVANNFRCKIPHVKAFFAVLTDDKNAGYFSAQEQELIHRHVPWTRVVEDVKTAHNGEGVELLEFIRKNQRHLVMKPSDEYGGAGVTLGWEVHKKHWESTMEKALRAKAGSESQGCWIVQERIPMRRGQFPFIGRGNNVEFRNMLVDFAPYIFRGRVAGYLTRLSATSLANVTSGGGQIPSFRVEPKKAPKRVTKARR